jgi:hypothetical protein
MSKICFITAIYGNYETTCKKIAIQTVPTDFICFTDNPNITKNGWLVDTTPYHLINPCQFDNGTHVNSMRNNSHTFNIAKYYKQSFQQIPILGGYDAIVWLDGTIEITCAKTSEYLLNHIYDKKIIGWHHEMRYGKLIEEARASVNFFRYCSTFWNGQHQPYQDVGAQFNEYMREGYNENAFNRETSHTPHMGVWITCFTAFSNKDPDVKNFLDLWYLQTLKYTTQDQIGFPYVCQKLNIIPYTLPNADVPGDYPHVMTQFYIKHDHQK